MQLLFRPATAADRSSVERIIEIAEAPEARRMGLRIKSTEENWLDNAIESGRVYIALVDEQPVGIAATRLKDESVLHIDHVAVLPHLQGRGIGGWILSGVEAVARAEKRSRLTFMTAAMMSELLHLGSRFGFHETHRMLMAEGGSPHVQVYMEKII
ncbi:MAG TPA: GNAT family N-acetyltransferase [Afifellaceae bacterium]|nr:GNAT family N-acetyltransferase [Afifellaceae bacterium]